MTEHEIAPAKINLFLHVGPVRADGYHALESLFVFAGDGDRLSARPARDISLEIDGPFAGPLAGFRPETNLVWRAALALKEAARVTNGAALRLEKRLPVAAGIGGGSSDAAAALRLLSRLWGVDIGAAALARLAFTLGADVPACLGRRPVFVSGAGEILRPGPSLPPLWVCLVNPRVELATGPVFRAFDRRYRDPAAAQAAPATRLVNYQSVRAYIGGARNDLEQFACNLHPSIAKTMRYLEQCPGCILARMSGSGATVFGLFASPEAARRASRRAMAYGWWAMATELETGAAYAGGRAR